MAIVILDLREKLSDQVLRLWGNQDLDTLDISKIVGASEALVSRIIHREQDRRYALKREKRSA